MIIGAAKTAGTKVERMRRVVVMLLKNCIVWSDLKIEFGEGVWSKLICKSNVSNIFIDRRIKNGRCYERRKMKNECTETSSIYTPAAKREAKRQVAQ